MFNNFFRKLSRKSIKLSRVEIAMIGGAAGLAALIHIGGGNGVHYTTADDKMPVVPPSKPPARTCLVNNTGDEYFNRCHETIKVMNCLTIDTTSASTNGHICYELALKPRESFIAATAEDGKAEVSACYTYEIPFTRIAREGFICR